ncbi:GNAT family N-acetyltransferase [Ethanoligenens harbinense]|uniref:N-acetyltransferase domain-containing protein n=1 Tax=Ethanoligenens harbinense (strain DSM 18485 / JCM 12961 / CGMCC 1.5033 / YUAN-3) TaxID=663278 RepID=E6U5B4_ETHHY|nr:GNAT family N-acetyltransferase [Ethanoligenens harbinense]ADU27927.1 hypothetical protein Ethha_2432 [Ethanoligenens harbinense YUAN-3]AVQ96956.1 N-acetyltransferase [Ethanoligenens harbinense YUAN-3]AYF39616.1 N-acetyltransferase [Ethanoligenens harbinense]AYF42444.1 N-acetyltransferase [Ethanoligenens harbinense]QCN93197.1 N-acetyltransferase [Ethanoligenens harbinense]
MFRCKKEIEELRKSNEEQKKLICKQSILLKDHQVLLENADRIQQEGDFHLYIQDGHLHYIQIKPEKTDFVYTVTFSVYRLSQHYYSSGAWISQAVGNIVMCQDTDFPYKTNNTFDLTSLDTIPDYQRQGHASHLISAILSFSYEHKVQLVSGDLYAETPIGIDNLRNFYQKNGFKVGKSSFSMALK